MRAFPALFVAALAQTGLASCSTHPLPDDVAPVSTYAIVQQIRCEAARAVRDLAPSFVNAAIAYEFEFDITESDTLTNGQKGNPATALFRLPFSSGAGTFSLSVNAGAEKTREAVRNFRLVDSFQDTQSAKCAKEALRKNWLYPITGDIGVHEVVATFIKLENARLLGELPSAPKPLEEGKPLKPPAGEVFVFADRLSYTTTLTAGANPVLVMTPTAGRFRAVDLKASLDASRVDMHKVTIAVAAGPQPRGARTTGARLRSAPGYIPPTTNSLLATTLVQTQVSAEQKALLELDRQRILTLQDQVPNLLVGP